MSEPWISPLEFDLETMRAMAERVSDLVTTHLATLREQPVRSTLSRREAKRLAGAIAREAPEEGVGFDAALAELAERVLPYHAREPHPRFLGYVPSIPTFPSVLGDWLATGYNFFAGVWPIASGPNEIELTVLDWFRQWLGVPNDAGGLLTSGGSTATMMAVVAARHARVGEDATLLPRLTMYTSTQAHSAVVRAAWIAGIARANVRILPTDDAWRLGADAVREAVAADRAEGRIPFLVVASAGTTNTGAVDALPALADLCARESLWLHVDAAYGAFAALTSRRDLLHGIERADSIVLDPHKWLFVPFECGCLLARDPARLKAAFHIFPEYLKDVAPGDEEVNFADYGEQLTRYARALKVWLSVRTFGLGPLRAMIERGIRLAEYAEALVRREREMEVLAPAQLGIVCFRVHPPSVDDVAELDALNERVNSAANAPGKFLISSTKVNGAFSLRVCTHNWRTTEADIDELIGLVRESAAAASLSAMVK